MSTQRLSKKGFLSLVNFCCPVFKLLLANICKGYGLYGVVKLLCVVQIEGYFDEEILYASVGKRGVDRKWSPT